MLDRPSFRRSTDPKTAVQTTKHTKHTKNEALTKRAVLNQPAGASEGRNLRHFVYFEYFVVAAARSAARTWPGVRRERQSISDGGGTLPRPTGAPVSDPVCCARLNGAGSGTGAPCRHDWPVAGRARGRRRLINPQSNPAIFIRSVDVTGRQIRGPGQAAGYVSECGEPFYVTMAGPWWYHTATSVLRVRNPLPENQKAESRKLKSDNRGRRTEVRRRRQERQGRHTGNAEGRMQNAEMTGKAL